MKFRVMKGVLIVSILMQLGACASSPGVTKGEQGEADTQERSPADPWEPMNRGIYAVNRGLDKVTLKPLSQGYKKVTPNFARRGISNFFANLG
ncbi:MAG: MlaA family lipoprotein, partial [Gammaproteobacteria bacterium]|nr:MlaA family lipoprotein [Gammaproteobacteria bacterium]